MHFIKDIVSRYINLISLEDSYIKILGVCSCIISYFIMAFILIDINIYAAILFIVLGGLWIRLLISLISKLSDKKIENTIELHKINNLKDEFISTVSHELRTPLTNIKMAASMLKVIITKDKELSNKEGIIKYLTILMNECDKESALINDLLDIEKLESGKKRKKIEWINVPEYLERLINNFKLQSKQKGIDVEFYNKTGLTSLLIMTSRVDLDRLLNELIQNAIKYTPNNNKIKICLETENICSLYNKQSNLNQIIISVSNYGVEIPTEEKTEVFNKFYRIESLDKHKTGGTGLGLYLVKELSYFLGGNIELTSSNNITTFKVSLPYILK